jgi:hypothetical protein
MESWMLRVGEQFLTHAVELLCLHFVNWKANCLWEGDGWCPAVMEAHLMETENFPA